MATQKIRVFAVNPSLEATRSLVESLAGVEDIEIVGESDDRDKALEKIGELVPDVVLIDNLMPDGPYSLSDQITQSILGIGVIVLADPPVDFRRALQSGARDVLAKPVQAGQLAEAIYATYDYEEKRRALIPAVGADDQGQNRKTKVITIFGTKGGVGKTTLAVNLACVLSKNMQQKTLLWDLDLHHGAVAISMNIIQRRPLTDMLTETQYLDQDVLEGYLERHQSGVWVLPAPFTPEFADFVSTEHVNKIVSVAKERWDYIIIDTASIFDEPAVEAMRQSDLILLVGGLDLAAMKNLKACLMVMDKLNFSRTRTRLIINRVGKEFGVFLKDVEDTLKMPVLATVPSDARTVITGLNQGVPAVLSAPRSDFARSIQTLARAIHSGARARPQAPAARKKGLIAR